MVDTVRLAAETDRAAVEEIVQAAYQPWVETVGGRPQPMDADYAALIAAGRVHVTGSGGVEGLIVLLPEPQDGVLLVENVAVRPEVHGRGIGRRLLAFAEEEAWRLHLPALRLYTHARMTRNIALYESLGYTETGRQMIDGGQLVHMRKQLDSRDRTPAAGLAVARGQAHRLNEQVPGGVGQRDARPVAQRQPSALGEMGSVLQRHQNGYSESPMTAR